jgi:3-oxoacyl-[acyl-carrier protein] reductase
MKVEGKVILITGAGSGLGLETVYRKCLKQLRLITGLVSAGANVIAVDRNIDNLKKSSQLHPYQLDVTDWQAMKQMYHDILSKYGRIDVVCNNAGLFERIFLID